MPFPNGLYDKGVLALRTSAIDWVADTFKVAFVRTAGDLPLYVPNLGTDEFFSSIPAGAVTRISDPLAGKTKTNIALGVDVYDADDLDVPFVVGPTFQAVVLFQDTGVPATSRLLAFWESAAGLPFTPLGGDVTIEWPNDAVKLFKLGPFAYLNGFFARANHQGIGHNTASAGYGAEKNQATVMLGVPWLNRKADRVGGKSEESEKTEIAFVLPKPRRVPRPRPWTESYTHEPPMRVTAGKPSSFTWEEEEVVLRVAGQSLTSTHLLVGGVMLAAGVAIGMWMHSSSASSARSPSRRLKRRR